MPKGIPLTEEELHHRRGEIARSVIHLFIQKHYGDMTMREIASAAGVGKSTLYDYFTNKDEIVVYLIEDQLEQLSRTAKTIIAKEKDPEQSIRRIVATHITFMQPYTAFYIRVMTEAQSLYTTNLVHIQELRHGFQDLIRDLIQAGVKSGQFRPLDPLAAARSLLAMINPITIGSRNVGEPDEIISEALDIFFKGVNT